MYMIEIICWFTIASAKLHEPLFFFCLCIFFLFEDLLFLLMDCTHDLESEA